MNKKLEYYELEEYQNKSREYFKNAIKIIIIGLIMSGSFIYISIKNPDENLKQYEKATEELERKKERLELYGITIKEPKDIIYREEYELYIINEALNLNNENCTEELKHNKLTKDYCIHKNNINFDKKRKDYFFKEYYIGIIMLIPSLFYSFMLYKKSRKLKNIVQEYYK